MMRAAAGMTSLTVASLATIDLVTIGLAGQTELKERTEFSERRVERTNPDVHVSRLNVTSQRHASRDKSVSPAAFRTIYTILRKRQKLGVGAGYY